jgi:hypothetical protein
MSLFTHEEICIGCKHAHFHDCCQKFCKCEIDESPDHIHGKCDKKEVSKPASDIAWENVKESHSYLFKEPKK